MMFRTMTRLATAAALLTPILAGAHAQSTTQGAISGTVFDATNAAVPGAAIVIHNDGTNADLALASDVAGFFKAQQLAPGTYTVTFKATGFQEIRASQVIVQVNLVTELNEHLAPEGNLRSSRSPPMRPCSSSTLPRTAGNSPIRRSKTFLSTIAAGPRSPC